MVSVSQSSIDKEGCESESESESERKRHRERERWLHPKNYTRLGVLKVGLKGPNPHEGSECRLVGMGLSLVCRGGRCPCHSCFLCFVSF